MKKLMKLFFCVLTVIIIIIPSTFAVSAAETRVYDNANVFTSEQKADLEKQIKQLKEKYNQDFAIVMTSGTNGKSIEAFSDNFFNKEKLGVGKNRDGTIFVIDVVGRKYHISTHASAITLIKNKNIKSFESKITSILKGKTSDQLMATGYYNASKCYLSETPKYFDANKKKLTPAEAAIALLISLAVGGIFIFGVKRKYGFAGPQCAYPLKENSSINLTRREDNFINTTVTSVVIRSSDSGGNDSSSHSSSDGDTFGGGGGSF